MKELISCRFLHVNLNFVVFMDRSIPAKLFLTVDG